MQPIRRLVIWPLVLFLATACAVEPRPDAAPVSAPTTPPSLSYNDRLSAPLHMHVPRAAHSATVLPDGQVLIAGGFRVEGTREIAIADAELYDPSTDTFQVINPMTEPRSGHTATLLSSGEVLIVGGWGPRQRTATAEVYDPQTQRFRATGSLAAPRASMTATLLPDGQVVIIGGDSARNTPQLQAEVYNTSTQSFTASGHLSVGRSAHTATLLQNGTVLVAGGSAGNDNVLASAELYDPHTGSFAPTGAMHEVRYKHAAIVLQTGHVLLVGGSNHHDWSGKYATTEEYDPSTGTFSRSADLEGERFKLADGVVQLGDGNLLVGSGNAQLEVYNTAKKRFQPSARLDTNYYYTVLTVLHDGRILLTGGYDSAIQPSSNAWIYS